VVYGKTRPEVIAQRKEVLRRLEAAEPIKDARITVAALVADYLEKALPASDRKASTQETTASSPGSIWCRRRSEPSP
jgi:hypothetical protein